MFALFLVFQLAVYFWRKTKRLEDPPESNDYRLMLRAYESALVDASYDSEAQVEADSIYDRLMETDAWHFERYLHNKRKKLSKIRK